MATKYIVITRKPLFKIDKEDALPAFDDLVTKPMNFTEAKKHLRTTIRDAITELKLQLKTIGSMRIDTHG